MQTTINLSEELHSGLQTHKRLLHLVTTQLGRVEDDLSEFENITNEKYMEMSKADFYLHLNEVMLILPLLTETLHSQMKSLEVHVDKADELFEQLREIADIKKDQ